MADDTSTKIPEMVERVARALAKIDGLNKRAKYSTPPTVYIGKGQEWRNWERCARAAIETMREPTGDMLLHIVAAEGSPARPIDPEEAWRIMINAALGR
ncbi:MAG TPA: hypothetical protein VGR84_18960 [Candidatus Acidoferrales bacterium]|nr:hypothetical protein [Candidatus Acidoferrales bacterium]